MTGRQVRRMVRWEAIVVSGLGAALLPPRRAARLDVLAAVAAP